MTSIDLGMPAAPPPVLAPRRPTRQIQVGKVGVAIDSIEDMRVLFRDIPLDRVSTSMTINAPAALLLLLYQLVAEEGINRRTGAKFREAILSKGSSRDYAEAYRAFRGRDKDTRPLLQRRGLAGSDL